MSVGRTTAPDPIARNDGAGETAEQQRERINRATFRHFKILDELAVAINPKQRRVKRFRNDHR